MPPHAPQKITISTRTIVTTLAILIGLGVLWFIRDILAIFFVALLLAALIDPFAHWFEHHKVPRGVGVIIVYILLLAIVTGAVILIVPPFVEQLGELVRNLGGTIGSAKDAAVQVQSFFEHYGLSENVENSVAGLQRGVADAISGIFSTIAGVFGGIATFILVLVLAFYMVVEEGQAKRIFRHVTPKKYRAYISSLMGRMQDKLGAWLRGQIILMVVVAALTYIGLLILGVKYALVLAIFAGVAEIVPYAGPIIAAIPAIGIGLTMSPLKAMLVAIIYFGIQQIENAVLTPKIMQKSVGLNPVVSLFALLVGFKLAGLVGALLAIPVATVISVFIKDILGANNEDYA
ncbi:MAG: AI-2E family transporter [Patescibacteria group bacterium]